MYAITNIVLVVILTTATIGQKVDESCILIKNNITGTCKFVKDCPEVDRLTSQGEHVQLCGFYLSIRPIFCCPNTPEIPPVVVPSVMESMDPAVINYTRQMCTEYTKNYTKPASTTGLATHSKATEGTLPNCDRNGINLISNGNITSLKEFPFAAAIGEKRDNAPIMWFCGGSLISDRFVLTAAHCVTGRNAVSVVRLGDYNLTDDKDGAIHQDYSVELPLIIHPEYSSNVTYNDIALIKLQETVTFTEFIQPACLWPEPSKIITNSTIAIGWGVTDYTATKGSDILLKVGLKVYDNLVCQTYYSSSTDRRIFPLGILPSMLCVGDTESEKDTCHGDSGGPLVKIDEENSCIQYIVGITSYGKPCGRKNSVAIYTRVTHYLGWIVSELQKN